MTATRDRLTDPRVRLAAGLACLTAAGLRVHADGVGPLEARLFRAANHLPDGLASPLWGFMQGGNLAAAPLAAVIAERTGRHRLAVRLLLSGSATWALTKVVKRCVGRPRPTTLVLGTRLRGRRQSGLGFVSGHAGVVTAIAAAALPELGPRDRRLVVAEAATVAVSRLYVGAHLPLDIVGGAALGVAVEAAVELATGGRPARRLTGASVRPASP